MPLSEIRHVEVVVSFILISEFLYFVVFVPLNFVDSFVQFLHLKQQPFSFILVLLVERIILIDCHMLGGLVEGDILFSKLDSFLQLSL